VSICVLNVLYCNVLRLLYYCVACIWDSVSDDVGPLEQVYAYSLCRYSFQGLH